MDINGSGTDCGRPCGPIPDRRSDMDKQYETDVALLSVTDTEYAAVLRFHD